MKKILSIALIALLAVGFVFAEVKTTGNAKIALGYDLGTSEETDGYTTDDYGFVNSGAQDVTATLEFEAATAGKKGEGDIYAEIAATATISAEFDEAEDGDVAPIEAALEITKADIVAGDVVVSILGPKAGANYAKAYYDVDGNKKLDDSTVGGTKAGVGGFAVSYKGYKASLAAFGNTEAKTNVFFAAVESKAFEVAEGATVQAAADVKFVNGEFAVADVNAKASYAADKFSATVAADVAIADEFDAEVAANVAFAPVTVDAYYETVNDLLSAKVSGAFAVEEVSGTAYVEGKDLLTENKRSVEVGATAKVDVISCGASVKVVIADPAAITIKGNVAYAPEAFTAKASVEVGLKDGLTALKPAASIESSKVIDGATVALEYKGADFKVDGQNGLVVASAKIAF